MSPTETPTIDSALTEFLAEQRERLSARTFANYEDVVRLLRSSLDDYGPNSLDARERRRWEAAFEEDDEAFCHLFGPEKIPEHLGEFLGYFMIRKVFASQELLKASGTVTKKLARWLQARGYIDEEAAGDAVERAQDAGVELPAADRLGELLHDAAAAAPPLDPEEVGDEDWVEDYLAIVRVESGRIWFERGVGPIAVPKEASDLAQPGWSLFVTAAKHRGRWYLLENGFVYP
jgi:hypothetical protein